MAKSKQIWANMSKYEKYGVGMVATGFIVDCVSILSGWSRELLTGEFALVCCILLGIIVMLEGRINDLDERVKRLEGKE